MEERFARQVILPEIGPRGQEVLARSRVLLLGAGGLGSAAALYLAAAGVGALGLVDGDVVEASNLNRQILHRPDRLGLGKVESARRTLLEFNPGLSVIAYPRRLDSAAAMAGVLPGYDLALDCLDNFPARYWLNQACCELGKPLVHGSVTGFEGQVMSVLPGKSPCYRCLYPAPPKRPDPDEPQGVAGVGAGVVGVLQAAEALKLLLGLDGFLVGRLLFLDLLAMSFQELRVSRDPGCPVCGPKESGAAPWAGQP